MVVKADRVQLPFKLLLKLLSSSGLLEIEIERTILQSYLRISCHVLAVGVLEITIIFNSDSDIQIFVNGDVLLNGS